MSGPFGAGSAGPAPPGDAARCPCGSGARYGGCCAPLHRGEARAPTAEALMRARYSAYVAGEADFLWRTWHPHGRPEAILFDPAVRWEGLEILEVVDGAEGDRAGVVEFRARYRDATGPAVLWERSTFMLRARRWMYVDGEFRR
ncbi:YchJ family protein [Corynebacterium sphenisci]|uniref:YchJ family protein n=1 Tax=Corynebacterium sphenisci TaxID=191493 RepID=UPI0026DEA2EE|nr:YchJ family metal-binding protein [Corynebacterium sphenisci]MDO5731449.1 YchJ family metal-binding protein [Corynebacterium sphenisci]